MDVQKFRKIHDKFDHGDRLTNGELQVMIEFYDDLVKTLDRAYLPRFQLMQREAWANQRRLHEMRSFRVN
jgi:hypothetical protein